MMYPALAYVWMAKRVQSRNKEGGFDSGHMSERWSKTSCFTFFLRLCWLCCPFYMSRSAVCFLHCCKKHAQCKCRPLCRLCPVSLHEIVIKTPFLRLHPFGSKLWAALWQCDIPKQWTVETETTAARCTWSSKVGRCNFKPEHLQVIRSMERALCLTHMSEVWIMVFSLRASVRIGD